MDVVFVLSIRKDYILDYEDYKTVPWELFERACAYIMINEYQAASATFFKMCSYRLKDIGESVSSFMCLPNPDQGRGGGYWANFLRPICPSFLP